MEFEGKVALITGGGSGIGRETAYVFAREGAKIFIADVNEEGGNDTVTHINAEGGTAAFMQVNVAESAAVAAMVDQTVKRFGGLDIAINNAGVASKAFSFFQSAEEADFDRIMNINAKGVWLCMKYEIPIMLEQGSGNIVNVASVAGLVGLPGDAIYTASKHAVVGLTRAAAVEVARKNIRINAVCPGYTSTAMVNHLIDERPGVITQMQQFIPMRRFGVPREIAEGILWLASDRSTFVTGAALPLDGGISAW